MFPRNGGPGGKEAFVGESDHIPYDGVQPRIRVAFMPQRNTARPAATKAKMEDGKGRRDVRGMIVRGIILKTLFPIPLTDIPLTLDCSCKMADRASCRICVMLTDCSTRFFPDCAGKKRLRNRLASNNLYSFRPTCWS